MKLTQYGHWTRIWSHYTPTYVRGHIDPTTILNQDTWASWVYITHGLMKTSSHNGKWYSISGGDR